MSFQSIPLAGVIGSPIAHSLSPLVHAYWLEKYGLKGHYIPIELSGETFEAGLRSLPKLGFKGVNVTLPFKERAISIADTITDRAALIGAANTLTFRQNGKIIADNTDGYGFMANILQYAPDWKPKSGPTLVLGAGGASRAVIHALLSQGVPEILIANRTRSRAEMLCEHFGARLSAIDWNSASGEMGKVVTVINTTSLGMTGKPDLKVSLDKIRSGTLVSDIVYNPLKTPLLVDAKKRGCRVVDGLGMLLHQAAPGFEAWFGRKPLVDQGLRDTVLGA